MSKVLKDGSEYFDGELVDLYEGRFAGAFLIDPVNGAAFSNGDLVTFMVTARVDTPKFSHVKKSGDLKRSNAMKIEAVVPLDPEKARWMYDNLSVEIVGVNDATPEDAPTVVDESQFTAVELTVQDTFFKDQS
jgi:hypothetical protein